MDSFYTPPLLSKRLADLVTPQNVSSIADFSIGGGELIKPLLLKFPKANVFGVDISDKVIKELSKRHSKWNLAVCNFIDETSRNEVEFLQEKKFDLIVQNSPFTCKGSTVYDVNFEGGSFKVSIAMLFLLTALKYLTAEGGVYAIMPISCVHSQKDREVWNYLKDHYYACVLEEPEKFYFSKKCSPNIVLVYAGNYSVGKGISVSTFPFKESGVKKVIRGSVRMQNLSFSSSKNALPLVHTTNMRDGNLVGLNKICFGNVVEGPGVLIPRVCNPNPGKVVLLDKGQRVVLSDCVVALRMSSQKAAKELKKQIHSHWGAFEHLYKGTGARYTTVSILCEAFGVNH